jgi:hypothetical protein
MNTKFWLKSLKGRECFKDLGINGRIMLKRIIGKLGQTAWIAFISLRTGRTQ